MREECACLATLEGAASIMTSHSIDARRYNVTESEALSDRRCSWNRSRLRHNAASIETDNEPKY